MRQIFRKIERDGIYLIFVSMKRMCFRRVLSPIGVVVLLLLNVAGVTAGASGIFEKELSVQVSELNRLFAKI